jgi:hypothetical protein
LPRPDWLAANIECACKIGHADEGSESSGSVF